MDDENSLHDDDDDVSKDRIKNNLAYNAVIITFSTNIFGLSPMMDDEHTSTKPSLLRVVLTVQLI